MELNELLSKYKEVENKTISVIKKKEFVEAVEPLLGKENTQKLYALKRAILISELADTIKEFPRLHKKQTIRLFENVACVKKEDSISGGRIMRPTLITIVEYLEAYTGRKILKKNSKAPLRYLEELNKNQKKMIKGSPCKNEEITIEDIADFFSERDGRKIERLIAQSYIRETDSEDIDRTPEGILDYLQDCCQNKFDKNTKVCELVPRAFPSEIESYYIVLYILETTYDRFLPNDFDCNQRTIGELIDFFVKR